MFGIFKKLFATICSLGLLASGCFAIKPEEYCKVIRATEDSFLSEAKAYVLTTSEGMDNTILSEFSRSKIENVFGKLLRNAGIECRTITVKRDGKFIPCLMYKRPIFNDWMVLDFSGAVKYFRKLNFTYTSNCDNKYISSMFFYEKLTDFSEKYQNELYDASGSSKLDIENLYAEYKEKIEREKKESAECVKNAKKLSDKVIEEEKRNAVYANGVGLGCEYLWI